MIKIFIDGCQAPKVGGSVIDPDLETPTDKIAKCFTKQENGYAALDLALLRNTFEESIIITKQKAGSKTDETNTTDNNIDVDRIITAGFSRGAWTAIKILPKLDHLGVDLYVGGADQPVMGRTKNLFNKSKAQQESAIDFSALKNLKRYFGYVGDYHLNTTGFEREYFWQTLVKLPQLAKDKIQIFLLPHKDHWDSSRGESQFGPRIGLISRLVTSNKITEQTDVSPIPCHMCRSLEIAVNEPKKIPEPEQTPEAKADKNKEQPIIEWYLNKFSKNSFFDFTPKALKLPIYGAKENDNDHLDEDPYYFEALKIHVKDTLQKLIPPINTDSSDMSNQQVYAIYHLLSVHQEEQKLEHFSAAIDCILNNSQDNNAKQGALLAVLNEVGQMCNYMRNEKKVHKVNNAKLLTAVSDYQHTVYNLSIKYLTDSHNDEVIAGVDTGKKLAEAERILSSRLVRFPTLHLCLQVLRETFSNLLMGGCCTFMMKKLPDTVINMPDDLLNISLAPYNSAYIRIEDEDKKYTLYYVNKLAKISRRLEVNEGFSKSLAKSEGRISVSKEMQYAINLNTGFTPPTSTTIRDRFFPVSPLEMVAKGTHQAATSLVKKVQVEIKQMGKHIDEGVEELRTLTNSKGKGL
ncbi:MAG: hypothetical protein Q8R83_01245 [Legionellaceae bacterium]|nr:hypothetical protein [Legionellaceae bacterium]